MVEIYKEKFMNILKSVFFSRVAIFVFFIVSVTLGLYWYEEAYITTIAEFHDASVFSGDSKDSAQLIAGTVLRGEFIALHDNLGTVRFRFTTFGRLNEDSIQFRMKEKGKSEWDVINSYTTNAFVNGGMYPFGFPIVPNSKGKTYQFEIRSQKGSVGNAVGISTEYNPMATQYIYSREFLMGNIADFRNFIAEKIDSLLADASFQLYILIFIIPTIFWVSIGILHSQGIKFIIGLLSSLYMHIVFFYLPVAMNTNIILFIVFSDIFIFASSVNPFILDRIFRKMGVKISAESLLSAYSFSLAIIFTLLIPINLYLDLEIAASRVAIGALYLTIFGLITSARSVFIPSRTIPARTKMKPSN